MTEDDYLNTRIEGQIKWHSQKSQHNKKCYESIRFAEIVCAATIPFLAGFSALESAFYAELAVGILGVVIAVLAAVSSLYKHQEVWMQYRATAEALKREKYLYLTQVSPYDNDKRYSLLVERAEGILSSQTDQWQTYMSEDKASDAA